MAIDPGNTPRPAELSVLTGARLRQLLLIWLGWAVLIVGYQEFAAARIQPQRPDYATAWTPEETGPNAHAGQPYLRGGFLNTHVAWDSEFYLSIATHGYGDPQMRAVAPGADPGDPRLEPKGRRPGWVSLNAAFFPVYPLAMRVLAWPLGASGMEPVAAATLAGVAISLAGTLIAMAAVSELAATGAGAQAADADRAAFYLVIMPASFFFAQVYTEGLFTALSFGALVMMRRRRLAWAAALAVAATWTRATGALLLVPLAWDWLEGGGPRRLLTARGGRELAAPLLIAAPALAYLAWRALMGREFAIVEEHYFGRAAFSLGTSAESWAAAAAALWSGPPPARAYYAVEFAAVGIGVGSCLLLVLRDRALALYGLAIIVVALTSGVAMGMHRYILGVPALYLVPARWGRSATFDRLWTLGNVLVMAVFALAFSTDFWAG